MGNRTSLIVPSGDTTFTYDKLNRLSTVTGPDGGVTIYVYDKSGNRKSAAGHNGTRAEYFYDSVNRLIRLENRKSNGALISSYVYTLGPSGNRIRFTEHNGRTVDYVYDDTYKLTQEVINDPDLGLRTISYTYDAVGNRLTKTDNGTTTNYIYDDNDRLLTENAISYAYDTNGNTVSKVDGVNTTSYIYDYLNRLVQVNTGSSVVQYAYGTDGTRMQKIVDGVMTNYLVDKNRDYAQVLEERDGNGNLVVSYNYGDDLISQNRSGNVSDYHYDGQLSTRQLTDAAQNVTDGYTYDAFGILINRSGATINDYLYTGQQYDPNVGFYYLRARYMNPSNGRFLTMDTYTGSVFEPWSLHKYIYCEGNSINRLDPSGNTSLIDLTARMVVIGIIASIIQVSAGYLTSWLRGIKKETKWEGFVMPAFGGIDPWVIGVYLAHFQGYHPDIDLKEGWGIYLSIMGGRGKGFPYTQTYFSTALVEPGFRGANPLTLVGATAWLSVGVGFGIGISATFFTMGFAHTPFKSIFSKSYGFDFYAAEILGGLSFPIALSTWHW